MKTDGTCTLRDDAPARLRKKTKPDLAQQYEQLLRLQEKVHALMEHVESNGQRSLVPREN